MADAIETDGRQHGGIGPDVREGLLAKPKRLPPRLFYDEEGSRLFEAITELPEYYLTRTELSILQEHAADILDAAGPVRSVVELGAGTARKTRVLLRALVERSPDAAFWPVDVSPAALAIAARSLAEEIPSLQVRPLASTYAEAFDAIRAAAGPKLVLFIGSSIGNYAPEDARDLLRGVRGALQEGDALLLGTDMAKSPDVLLPAYDDAAGVTARFNKNVLARINRELGGRFDLARFRHAAVWNAEASAVEMHLVSEARQAVRIDALDLEVGFEHGESIHTESSFKFTAAMIEGVLDGARFVRARSWYDERRLFGVHLARAS